MKPTKNKIILQLLEKINDYYRCRMIKVYVFFPHYNLMKYEIVREI